MQSFHMVSHLNELNARADVNSEWDGWTENRTPELHLATAGET